MLSELKECSALPAELGSRQIVFRGEICDDVICFAVKIPMLSVV